uniref:Uncharacterized protein n=1 Tax=Graphocephala atropunctata TaxID=36148 RepID=A0A1B6LG20_9HEMI
MSNLRRRSMMVMEVEDFGGSPASSRGGSRPGSPAQFRSPGSSRNTSGAASPQRTPQDIICDIERVRENLRQVRVRLEQRSPSSASTPARPRSSRRASPAASEYYTPGRSPPCPRHSSPAESEYFTPPQRARTPSSCPSSRRSRSPPSCPVHSRANTPPRYPQPLAAASPRSPRHSPSPPQRVHFPTPPTPPQFVYPSPPTPSPEFRHPSPPSPQRPRTRSPSPDYPRSPWSSPPRSPDTTCPSPPRPGGRPHCPGEVTPRRRPRTRRSPSPGSYQSPDSTVPSPPRRQQPRREPPGEAMARPTNPNFLRRVVSLRRRLQILHGQLPRH